MIFDKLTVKPYEQRKCVLLPRDSLRGGGFMKYLCISALSVRIYQSVEPYENDFRFGGFDESN